MSKSGTRRCPSCLADVLYESQLGPNMIKSANSSNSISLAAGSTVDIKKLHSIKDDFRKKQDLTSSKLGTKMLQGWTLLGSVCPKLECGGTPLMSLNDGNCLECVSCDCHYKLSETSGDLVMIDGAEVATEEVDDDRFYEGFDEGLYLTNNAAKIKHSKELLEKASHEISKKLLCGWSLLSEVCSGTCNGEVPLMKDLNGNVGNLTPHF